MRPAFRKTIPIARPDLGEAEADAARRAILSGWVTQGPEVASFEQEFCDHFDSKFACAVSSCTAALHIALLSAGVGQGHEVIVPSHSFIATTNAVRYCGALPVFVDIEPKTFNIDPNLIGDAITSRTRAILCVHQMGLPCDTQAILAIARREGIAVIEDAACAAGSAILNGQGEWELIGRPVGDIACFSFHPRKVITTGDGGMLTHSEERHDTLLRLLRQHGMSVSDTVRHKSSQVLFESYPIAGFNYRMTDIQAAVGRQQLRRLDEILKKRRVIADHYKSLLSSFPAIGLPYEPEWARSNWQSYCVRLPEGCDQRGVMQFMLDAGISTRRGVMCAHREEACRDIPVRHSLRHSEEAQDRCIVIPLFPQMTGVETEYVATTLSEACVSTRG